MHALIDEFVLRAAHPDNLYPGLPAAEALDILAYNAGVAHETTDHLFGGLEPQHTRYFMNLLDTPDGSVALLDHILRVSSGDDDADGLFDAYPVAVYG